MARRGQLSADGLDRVVGYACLAGDDLAEVHLDRQVLLGENRYNEECTLQCIHLCIEL